MITARPQMRVGMRVDELRRDAHLVARALHRAFDHRIHAQLARDLRQRFARALVAHGGSPRDDLQSADLRQLGGQLFRHAVGKIFLRRIGG